MSDRNPADLTPEMQNAYAQWDVGMKAANVDYILTCTLRTQAEQEALFAQGRTAPGHIVTWTLHSKHLTGEAFDFVVMVNGKPDWLMVYKDQWDKAVEIGKGLGLSQVIGSDGRILEFAHLQMG
jgi:peptidoglycan L-alanyl-D-glutamate endopeptidase CwlK